MTYNGGKGASGVHQQIINKMPKHRVYIETHLGSGNILRKKKSQAWPVSP
jgi:DNA adenine methylase